MTKKYSVLVQEIEEEKGSEIGKMLYDLENEKLEIETKKEKGINSRKEKIIDLQGSILDELSFEKLAELAIEILKFDKEKYAKFALLSNKVMLELSRKLKNKI
jgi:hypothetical protein